MSTEIAAQKTPKTTTIERIVDYIIITFKPHENPCVLMWRETMNGFNREQSENYPLWVRDDKTVHESWKRFGPGVVSILNRKYKLTVVKVGARIRKYTRHGGLPDRDDKCRTDAYYRSCLPSSDAPVFGFVSFPRDIQQDHPLIVASLDRRGRATSTSLENHVVAVNTANDLGTLSAKEKEKNLGHVEAVVHRALEDRYPLFPKKIESS